MQSVQLAAYRDIRAKVLAHYVDSLNRNPASRTFQNAACCRSATPDFRPRLSPCASSTRGEIQNACEDPDRRSL
jgi:hypothetical protein